jgi:hypothetical protein
MVSDALPAFYIVPTYKMKISGSAVIFKVIRFGLTQSTTLPHPVNRICDIGLFKKNTYNAVWIPSHQTQAITGAALGAWKFNKDYYIQEGSRTPTDAWNSNGCIEVVGKDQWLKFLFVIRQTSGDSNHILSIEKNIKIHIDFTATPMATLI